MILNNLLELWIKQFIFLSLLIGLVLLDMNFVIIEWIDGDIKDNRLTSSFVYCWSHLSLGHAQHLV